MKFWAKIRIDDEKKASELIWAFFKEFNPNSSIEIKGKEAKIEIIFDDNPPMDTIEATKNCEVMEFYFGKALGEYIEDENTPIVVEDTTEETTRVVNEEVPEQAGETKKRKGRHETKELQTTKTKRIKIVNLPELEEIAKAAISFEHFVKLVSEWLEISKKQDFFENLVMAAVEAEDISWKEVEQVLKNKGITYTQWDRIYIGQQVSEKLKDSSVTILPFLKNLREYKNYSFGIEIQKEVKMEYMPEIPQLKEIFKSVDKTQSIEERVRYVLNSMGLEEKKAQEQQEIFEIANTAVRTSEMRYDNIFSNVNVLTKFPSELRMTFSQFVNDFVGKYDADKKVKLLDFLKELQKNVMNENEIKS